MTAKRERSRAYYAMIALFDNVCDALWWVPGVPRVWAFVANRTYSRDP